MRSEAADLVRVRFYAAARAAVGATELEVTPASAEEILRRIAGSNPQALRVFSLCSILVGGEILHDLSLLVAAGEEMDVLPPFAGGSL